MNTVIIRKCDKNLVDKVLFKVYLDGEILHHAKGVDEELFVLK